MKAKIIVEYGIWDESTKSRISRNGETVEIIGQSDGGGTLNTGGIAFCCILNDGTIVNIQDSYLQIIQDEQLKPIDWEQRRWDASVAIYCKLIEKHPYDDGNFMQSLHDADALIEEFKKQKP